MFTLKPTIIFQKKKFTGALKFYLLLKELISTIEVGLVFNMENKWRLVINMSKQPKYWKPITASEYYEEIFCRL